jgi:DNA repair exonuclease SbcCD ATPase subunit
MDRSSIYDNDHLANPVVTPIRRVPSSRSRSISGSPSISIGPSPANTPSLLSSPSVASSTNGIGSPLRNELGQDGGAVDASRADRFALSQRLSQLAQQLAEGEQVDEAALVNQVDQLEMSLLRTPPQQGLKHRRPLSLELRSRIDYGSVFSSPPPSLFRSRFSDLSMSLLREREREKERDEEAEAELEAEKEKMRRMGMTIAQANKIIAESGKLNEELSQMVESLKSRQEESDHIHSLLIERAERAAQRIMFLQNRISYLEEELHENDDELQHLRISLKAIEIQMPPHPDKELQRCISNFKEDYQALKRKRVNRSSMASLDSSMMDSFRMDTTQSTR